MWLPKTQNCNVWVIFLFPSIFLSCSLPLVFVKMPAQVSYFENITLRPVSEGGHQKQQSAKEHIRGLARKRQRSGVTYHTPPAPSGIFS